MTLYNYSYEFRQVAVILFLAAQPQVIDPPSSQTLPLGANATFTCRTIGRVQWEISDSSIDRVLSVTLPLMDANQLNDLAARGIYATATLVNSSTAEYLSTLMLTTYERNKTEVYCRGRLSVELTQLDQPATVILYGECSANDLVHVLAARSVILVLFHRVGPPDPPTGLAAIPGGLEELHLTWTAPFTLEGVQTNYTLTINNTDSAGDAQVISLNATTYTFQTEGSSCDVYQFRVRASNAAGVSSTTEPVNAAVPACTSVISTCPNYFSDHLILYDHVPDPA